MIINKKNYNFSAALFLLFCAFILVLGIRGISGNPTAQELNLPQWKENGPLELSPERGRFTLTYSVAEDGTFKFSESLAKFAMPDLVVNPSGQYVSMFAPSVSFLVLPGFILGKYFGASQTGTFAVIALFALFNIILIRSIAIRLGASMPAASLGAFTFAFATPAFAYAGTLYQHHISVFIILLGIYALIRWNTYWSLALVWFLTALSFTVDNPNIFFMLPVALFALGRIIIVKNKNDIFSVKIKFFGFIGFLAVIFPVAFFLWFNNISNGSPFQLSGTLPSAQDIAEQTEKPSAGIPEEDFQQEKSAIGFFKTRNLTNGFYIHFLSPDRGMINYAPIILIGIFGIIFLYRKNAAYANLLAAVIGLNVLLYSMWGDPCGGWAFGSRYLIPAYAMLAIGLGIVLTQWRKNTVFLIIFFVFFSYSAKVNTLGALTSIANPPQIEILELEKKSGKVEKYTYERNEDYLKNTGSKSFIYQAFLKNKLSAQAYFEIIIVFICLGALILLFGSKIFEQLNNKNRDYENKFIKIIY